MPNDDPFFFLLSAPHTLFYLQAGPEGEDSHQHGHKTTSSPYVLCCQSVASPGQAPRTFFPWLVLTQAFHAGQNTSFITMYQIESSEAFDLTGLHL